jgi:peptidoglycan/xylan/chitin deacetylase (PgdA/CDA1 family)
MRLSAAPSGPTTLHGGGNSLATCGSTESSLGDQAPVIGGFGLDVKRRTLLLGTLSCTVLACSPANSIPTSAPSPAASARRGAIPPASSPPASASVPAASIGPDPSPSRQVGTERTSRRTLIRRYSGKQPTAWGEDVPRVVARLPTSDRVVALTLDACGGRSGSGYDAELIQTLRREKVPATLFVNARWIEANPRKFAQLAADPLFEIANHGTEHRALSVTGRSVYGIKGTSSVAQVIDEVVINQRLITKLTGAVPAFFRSGTAYYDDVAVRVVNELGLQVVNFDVLGDAGATYSADQVADAMLRSKPGSIILAHMNRPDGGTAEGINAALPKLSRRGCRFVRLSEYLH